MRADQIGPYASHMLNSTRLLLPDILWQSMHSLKCNRRTSLGQTLELFDAKQPLQIADQGCFHVSGHYVNSVNSVNGADGRLMVGQMFVQYQIPARQTQPYPVVMMHGGGQTGVNFLGTPDGRRGCTWSISRAAGAQAILARCMANQRSAGRNRWPSASPRRSAPNCGRRRNCTRNGRGRARRGMPCSISSTPRKSRA